MTGLVLVHGAWHGAWCWYKTIPALAARGIAAHAIDLPGHGLRRAEMQTLAGYAEAIAGVARGFDKPVAVLGHSMGGQAIAAAAELAPERISLAIHLAGFLPKHGESIVDQTAGDEEAILAEHLVFQDDGTIVVPDEALKLLFYADCSDDDLALAKLMLVPQAAEPSVTAITQTAERAHKVRRAYIACRDDKALGQKKQHEWAARAGVTPVVLETSHSPFFSAPGKLADAIARILSAGPTAP